MSGKKAGVALPAVALYAILAIVLVLMGYSIYFFGFGFGQSRDVTINTEHFQSDITLINLLKTEINGKTAAELIMGGQLDGKSLEEALSLIPGAQMLVIKRGADAEELIISESSEGINFNTIQTAALPKADGIIEVELYA